MSNKHTCVALRTTMGHSLVISEGARAPWAPPLAAPLSMVIPPKTDE